MPALSSIPPLVQTQEIPWSEMFPVSVEQYHAMIAAGAITNEDKVELLRGRLVRKMAKHPPHETANYAISRGLDRAVPAQWFVAVQRPLTTSDSEPEPDVMIVRGAFLDFAQRHPLSSEVGLVVDVADSSLSRDRGYKRQLYAEAGIPFYWIANLIDHQVEVYSRPVNGDYTMRSDYSLADAIPLILDGVEAARFDVKDLLP